MNNKKSVLCVMLFSIAVSLLGCGSAGKENNSSMSIETTVDNVTDSRTEIRLDEEKPTISSIDLYQNEDVQKKIKEIERYIDKGFYFDTDKDYQEEAIYDGIMQGLDDPYSVYYTKEEYNKLMEEDSGEYSGIGAVVTQTEDKLVKVVRPMPKSPCLEAGLQAEDIIVEVDGESTAGQDLDTVVKKLRGPSGSTVKLKVYRAGETDYLNIEITRRTVENITVEFKMLEGRIAYIQVQQFYANTDELFIEELKKLEKTNINGIIIDLRDNPGGLVDTVCNMCDFVMDEGPIVSMRDRDGNILDEQNASSKHTVDVPMVVLVNGNSASASEIYAGAMKDTGKATIVGTKTFGKGIVQSVIPLSDGSAIKLTIAKYFTPAGNDIHRIGIEPDYVVELPDGRMTAVGLDPNEDTQLLKAIELLTK